MSLFIVVESFGNQTELKWNKTDKKLDVNISLITEVRAKGNELDCIANRMLNVPVVLGKGTQIWFGDMAKFIAVNIGAIELDD